VKVSSSVGELVIDDDLEIDVTGSVGIPTRNAPEENDTGDIYLQLVHFIEKGLDRLPKRLLWNREYRIVGIVESVSVGADQLFAALFPGPNEVCGLENGDRGVDGIAAVAGVVPKFGDSELLMWIATQKQEDVLGRLVSKNPLLGERELDVHPASRIISNTGQRCINTSRQRRLFERL
jgi:hypothetical protein